MLPDYVFVIVMECADGSGRAMLPRAYTKEKRADADLRILKMSEPAYSPRVVKVPLDRCLCVVEHL